MILDYSETFETEKQAYCICAALNKKLVRLEEFIKHLDVATGYNMYQADYVCAKCFKPSKFYVQECEYCPEAKCFFYGRPKRPGDRSFTKCLRCKMKGK